VQILLAAMSSNRLPDSERIRTGRISSRRPRQSPSHCL